VERATGVLRVDGADLHWQRHRVSDPVALMLLIHGGGEHCGRYDHVAEFFADRGFEVIRYDQRGLGQSSGRRGHVARFAQYIEDALTVTNHFRSQVDKGVPLAVVGHSMGGLVATLLALDPRSPVDYLVLCGACYRLQLRVPAWKKALGNILSAVTPGLTMPNGISSEDVCRDVAVQQDYAADPNNVSAVSVGWYREFNRTMHEARSRAGQLQGPVLFLQGTDDRLVDEEAVYQAYEAACEPKRLIRYEGWYHELLNEPERQRVFHDIIEWLEEMGLSMARGESDQIPAASP